MVSAATLGLLVAVLALTFALTRLPSAPALAARAAVGALSVALAWLALQGKLDGATPLIASLWLAGGVASAALPTPPPRRLEGVLPALGWTLGPLAAALALGQTTSTFNPKLAVHDPATAALWLASGAALALGAGFAVRALARVARAATPGHGLEASGTHLAAAAFGLLALGRLRAQGPGGVEVSLPAVDSLREPALWLSDAAQGLPIVAPVPNLGPLLALGAAVSLAAALAPKTAKPFLSVGAGSLLLVAGFILLAADGSPVTPDPKTVTTTLKTLGAPEPLVQNPLIWGRAPYTLAAALGAVPLALAWAAGLGSLGYGVAALRRALVDAQDEWDDLAHRLAARDAALAATLCAWLAAAGVLFVGWRTTGVWGPISPAEHLASGGALASTAALLALYALGGDASTPKRALRELALGLLLASLAACAAGGLVSALGAFEL